MNSLIVLRGSSPLLRGLAALSLVLALLLASGLTATPAQAAEPVRILPLGDSITHGYGTARSTWRSFLWHRLQNAGRDVDFVGNGYGLVKDIPVYSDFDQGHEGHSGWKADRILANARAWATQTRPDVVLLHIGTNDVKQGESNDSTIAEIEGIVNELRAARPGVTVVIAQIIPMKYRNAQIQDLNQRIAQLANTIATPTSNVVVVDQHTGFDLATESDDGTHPNERGDRKMAERWSAALLNLLPKVAPAAEVALSLPATASAGADLALTADVTAETGVSKVAFYRGEVLIGEDATAPYGVTWRDVPAGRYPVTARATLAGGRVVSSLGDAVTVGTAPSALFVVGSPKTMGAQDGAMGARLQAHGLVPVTVDDNVATATDATGKKLVAISISVSPTRVAAKYAGSAVPLITWEGGIFDDLGMVTSKGSLSAQTQGSVKAPTHPLAGGLSGTQTLTSGPQSYQYGRPTTSATNAVAAPSSSGKALVFGYESGAAMVGRSAPDRRVGFFAGTTTPAALTPSGWRLYDAALAWSLRR